VLRSLDLSPRAGRGETIAKHAPFTWVSVRPSDSFK
jgi:hypothetical protein